MRSRREFLTSASAAAVALVGMPTIARSQSVVTLRISSSLPADAELGTLHLVPAFRRQRSQGARRQDRSAVFSQQPARQRSRRGAAGEDRLDRHDAHGIFDLGHGRAGAGHARPGLRVRQLRPRVQVARRRRRREARAHRAGAHPMHSDRLGRRTSVRAASTPRQPVHNLAEVKGVKLRVLPTTAFIETFKLHRRHPHADPVQRALHRAADRRRRWLRARRRPQPCRPSSSKSSSRAGSPSICSRRWCGDRQARLGQAPGRACVPRSCRPPPMPPRFSARKPSEHGKQAIEELKRLGISVSSDGESRARASAPRDARPNCGPRSPRSTRRRNRCSKPSPRAVRDRSGALVTTRSARTGREPAVSQRWLDAWPVLRRCSRACRRRRARLRRRAGRLLLGDLALLPARAIRLGRGDRPRADGRRWCSWAPQPRSDAGAARRRRQSAQVVSGALARVRGAALRLDRRRSRPSHCWLLRSRCFATCRARPRRSDCRNRSTSGRWSPAAC